MTCIRRTLLLLGVLALAGSPTGAAQAQTYVTGAREFITALADEAMTTLTEPDLSSDERRQRFRRLFQEGFAVAGIARFALGRYWRKASDNERDEYVELFEDVIVNVWADRFADYSGQKFSITDATSTRSAREDEQAALVRSVFWSAPDSPVRIDWRVANKGEIYKITDVFVEGVSMASTHRDEFAAVVRREGVGGLLSELRERRDAS
ncbi:MAG: phospholipid-binding protein MlaC [Alphaproteobacteria bacterium]